MTDRRRFVAWLGSLPIVGEHLPLRAAPPIVIDAMPTALYQQPDGRNNLVQVAVSGLDAPAGRARVTDRRGTLVGTAGLLATGAGLAGELWVPLSRASGAEFQIDVEVGKQRVGSRRVRLTPPRRWTVYWIASSHTDVRLTALQEDSLELHRRNLDAALARLPPHLVRREPRPRRGGGARPRHPRRQDRRLCSVRAAADGDPRPRDVRTPRLARGPVRARARLGLSGCATGRRARAIAHVSDPARRERRALSRERGQPRAG